MSFHCGDNTDYQHRKPSRALGQEDILPSIPTHNLLIWGGRIIPAYMGGRISSCPKPR